MKGVFFKNVRRYFKQYCNRSSVHGFQYFGEDRSVFERLWWIFFFVICLVVCGFCIFEIYNKWRESPIIVNFANSETSINEIPFPAVTICSEWKTNPKTVNITKIVQKQRETNNLTSEEHRKLNVLKLICKRLVNRREIEIQPEEFFKDLKELHLHLPLQFKRCAFQVYNSLSGCSRMFNPIMTEEGICYSLNMIHEDEIFRENIEYPRDPDNTSDTSFLFSNWSLQNGYNRRYETEEEGFNFKIKKYREYPNRAVPGVNNGLSLKIVSPQETSDPGCQTPVRGYKMLVHSPITVPLFRQDFIRIPSDANVVVAVKPQVVKTSKKVQKYSPDRRKCYFETERRLKFFKIYTSSNCKLECLTNYTLLMCDCAAFYMPRENGTKICSPSGYLCPKIAEHYMTRATALKLMNPDFIGRHCNCLPTCSELFYEVEVTQSKWEWTDEYQYEKLSNQTLTSVTVYFKSDTFIARERNELYGPLDFLSNFGGLIGLFTGFSMLSIIEILYFLSVRIIFNRRLYGQWAGLEN